MAIRRSLRRALAAAFVLAVSCAPAQAFAAALSMNHIPLADGADMNTCKAMARAAVDAASLRPLAESEVGVIGGGPNGLVATVYCMPEHGVAMVAVAGDSRQETRPVLFQMLGALSQAQ